MPSSNRQAPKTEYYPRNIGLIAAGGPNSHSYLITGREGKGAEAQILNVFLKHRASILSQSSQVDRTTGEFAMLLVCDLSNADSTADDFLIYLRDIKWVKTVLASKMKDKLFDGMLFPLTFLDSYRVIALRSDFIFQLQDRLEPGLAKSLLTNWGKSYALDVIQKIREKLGETAKDEIIIENVIGYLRAAGWGAFHWKNEGEVEQVILQDPPVAENGDARGNLFILGLAGGLVSTFLKKSMAVMTAYYDKDARMLTMVLADEKSIAEPVLERHKMEERPEPSVAQPMVQTIVQTASKTIVQPEVQPVAKPSPQPAPQPVIQVVQTTPAVEEKKAEEEQKQIVEVPVMAESDKQVIVARRPANFKPAFEDDEYSVEELM